MNHKDFIKNYLPGLTRGVYAVRLLLKVAPTYIAALLICNILSGILTSIELLLSQNFLNSLTVFLSGYITIETLLFWLISIFLASVAMSGCTYVSSCLNSLVSDKFNLYITNRILEKTTFFSMKEYDNVDLYNKIHLALEETPNRCLTLLTTLFSTVRLTTQLIGITILIANYNVLILLVCIVTSIPMLRLSNRVGKFWYTVGAERAEGLRKCNRLKELLVEYNNIKEIKLFDIGDMLKNRVVRQQTDYVNSNKHYYKKFCRLNTVYAMAQDSVSLLLKIAIIMQAVTQKLTIGAASMYISSVDSFNASFQGMLSQISTLYEQTRYLSYISDIENISVRKQEEGTPLTEKIKSIRFENVSFHYPNSHNMVLKNFSYTFETGKTYALVGMNGSGKTTLIKLLMRLYTPINGHIYVNGVDIEEISFSSLQQQISAVFQDFIRYPFNVAENIAIHDADNINDFERVKEAAVHSEATEFIDALPLGYRTTLEKEWNGGTELSGGQWQKIAIARCFYKSSSVVILDEPFSAIDSFSEEQIIKSLASDTINKMCIFVTHRFNNICLADQILVLKDAQLIENGTHGCCGAAGYSVFMLSVKPELEQAFNQLCSDVVLHIRIIIAVHFGEIADIPGISVKDSLYRYGVALMCFYYRVIGEK